MMGELFVDETYAANPISIVHYATDVMGRYARLHAHPLEFCDTPNLLRFKSEFERMGVHKECGMTLIKRLFFIKLLTHAYSLLLTKPKPTFRTPRAGVSPLRQAGQIHPTKHK